MFITDLFLNVRLSTAWIFFGEAFRELVARHRCDLINPAWQHFSLRAESCTYSRYLSPMISVFSQPRFWVIHDISNSFMTSLTLEYTLNFFNQTKGGMRQLFMKSCLKIHPNTGIISDSVASRPTWSEACTADPVSCIKGKYLFMTLHFLFLGQENFCEGILLFRVFVEIFVYTWDYLLKYFATSIYSWHFDHIFQRWEYKQVAKYLW